MQSVSVLIPLALPGPYEYAVPEGLGLVRGDFVRVPLGPRQVMGVVWGPGAGKKKTRYGTKKEDEKTKS